MPASDPCVPLFQAAKRAGVTPWYSLSWLVGHQKRCHATTDLREAESMTRAVPEELATVVGAVAFVNTDLETD